ncbi:hypothetical protein BDP27DRAFT_1370748 [Rhodocollybia butyracea]|uniref:Uncharacterized protein n=1 Tax=Rhodocollybia butyracea TaxID=206335 RepID=A0A9P5PBP2_9AGAR|nr:hypothetical protein BDP27DRAFT_1370748 [Rhodocollybia butyracea]
MSSKFSDVFPPTLPLKSPPPLRNDVQQGFRTPQYLLGWVIRLSEAAVLFDNEPRHGNPVSHVASMNLSVRWPEVRSKYPALEALSAPASIIWDYPYVIIYICSNNFPKKMKLVLEHEDEAIQAAMEVIGFSSEKEAELKWHRPNKQNGFYIYQLGLEVLHTTLAAKEERDDVTEEASVETPCLDESDTVDETTPSAHLSPPAEWFSRNGFWFFGSELAVMMLDDRSRRRVETSPEMVVGEKVELGADVVNSVEKTRRIQHKPYATIGLYIWFSGTNFSSYVQCITNERGKGGSGEDGRGRDRAPEDGEEHRIER